MTYYPYFILKAQDPQWHFLFDFPEAPTHLFIQCLNKKSLDLLFEFKNYGLGIVGTRHPSQRILSFLDEQIPLLKNSKLITLSGLAPGIDQKCHSLSIESDIKTVGILGCGLKTDYPKNSQNLKSKIILNGGLIISEFPEYSPPLSFHFTKRNRLIAAWSKSVWIAECKIPSGALNTAHWARQYDKTCYSTPSFPGDPYSKGNQLLLDDFHAQPYWGAHSLGSTWLELSTIQKSNIKNKNISAPSPDLSTIIQSIKHSTLCDGYMSLQELIEELIQKKFSFNKAFTLIHQAKDLGLIRIDRGIIQLNLH